MEAPVVERAVAAAVAVAAGQGLRVDGAVPVGTGSNVIVALRPHPIVARVMSGTVVLHPDPRAWLAREIAVGAFLRGRGAPVVAPAWEIDPGPHVHGDLWLSFWEHVEIAPQPPAGPMVGRALRVLHEALAAYDGPLPPRSALLGEIDWLLEDLPDDDGASAGLVAERDRLAELILGDDHVAGRQPLHGDASLSNLLATPSGPRFNDFEDVCVGAVVWDVASLWSDARATRGDAFAAEVLAGYGGTWDPAALARVDQALTLYGTLWHRHRRRPGPGARGPGDPR